MKIAFRADASLKIGNGHVVRCLTLADAMREHGAVCNFICRPHLGHLFYLINQRGYEVLALPALQEDTKPNSSCLADSNWLGTSWDVDAWDTQEVLRSKIGNALIDWLIVDHYALDARWEDALRPRVRRIMAIDDLADRRHVCDLLLDQNLGRMARDYDGLIEVETRTLIGPQYALLRPEFAAIRPQSLARRQSNPQVRRLLITMGGVDKNNATCQVLDVLKDCELPTDLRIIVVMGPYAPWLAQVQELSLQMPWPTEVLINVSNMPQIMAESDLAIGAAGATAWELCCLGLPSLLLVMAKNQLESAAALKESEAAIVMDDVKDLKVTIERVVNNKFKVNLLAMVRRCAMVTDGRGCKKSVAALRAFDLIARKAKLDDSLMLFKWVNDDLTRKNAFSSGVIPLTTHIAWLKNRLKNQEICSIFIVEYERKPIGQVRFDEHGDGWLIDYSIAPEERGKGLGAAVLSAALHLFTQARKKTYLIAKVKLENIASHKIFEALDFIVYKRGINSITYEKIINLTP